MAMKEKEYVMKFDELFKGPGESARLVLDAIAPDLPPTVQQELTKPVEPLELEGSARPDFALHSDSGLAAVFEFKAPGTNINATRISTLLNTGMTMGTDPMAQHIREAYPGLDDPDEAAISHDYASCTCVAGQYDRSRPGHHYPGLLQGDAYRLYLPGVPTNLRPSDLSDIGYVLMAPNEQEVYKWTSSHVSAEEWAVVRLYRVVARLRPHALVNREIREWIDLTEFFISSDHRK